MSADKYPSIFCAKWRLLFISASLCIVVGTGGVMSWERHDQFPKTVTTLSVESEEILIDNIF